MNTVDVEVRDTDPPVISLNGPPEKKLRAGVDTYKEFGATATDRCESDIVVLVGGDEMDSSQ